MTVMMIRIRFAILGINQAMVLQEHLRSLRRPVLLTSAMLLPFAVRCPVLTTAMLLPLSGTDYGYAPTIVRYELRLCCYHCQ
eukprot:3941673-Rhodomonas_salina.1